ncbi:Coatomer subunit delta-2 [Galdieria sulphuraria]|nr:Coatomer subunit delta-2 [Galdieria sulphuraria]
MTIISVSILNRSGKVLLSRQFVEISRIRVESLLSAFPRLIGSSKQHTYVETESVRYLYQPLESLYVVIITTKGSNVVEDLETLRLICKLIPEYLPIYASLDEESIVEAAFELIAAFDEVVDWGGLRESVDVQQVHALTEMFSHEEKLANMIKESKMLEAKEVAKRRAESLSREKSEREKLHKLGSDFGRLQGRSFGGISAETYQASMAMPETGFTFTGMSNYGNLDSKSLQSSAAVESSKVVSAGIGGKGLSLGGNRKQDAVLEALQKEGELVKSSNSQTGIFSEERKNRNLNINMKSPVLQEAVHFVAQEDIVLEMNRDGVIHSFEIKGNLILQVSDSAKASIRIHTKLGDMEAFQVRTHPNIDKNLWTSSQVLGLRDASRGFPVGSPLSILRWRLTSSEEKMIPLSINCWPAESSTETVVIIEYELVAIRELENVAIHIPVPKSASTPKLRGVDGEFTFNSRSGMVEWNVSIIDKDKPQGSLEFVTEPAAATSFFPVQVSFISNEIYGDIGIESVRGSSGESEYKFSFEKLLTTERYSIVHD